jgi:hypothetical protein
MQHTDEIRPSPRAPVLADYMSLEEMCRETGKSERTLRTERQTGRGPPFVKWGAVVLYPRDGFLAWLKSIEHKPRRGPRNRGNAAA